MVMVIKCDIWRKGNEGRKVIKAMVLSLRNRQSVYDYWCEFLNFIASALLLQNGSDNLLY